MMLLSWACLLLVLFWVARLTVRSFAPASWTSALPGTIGANVSARFTSLRYRDAVSGRVS